MKKLETLLSLFLIISLSSAQEIIENPEKPLSSDAGRIVELKEVMRIDDIGSDYYFQYPRNFKVAPDGSLFIADREQLIRFDFDGKFIQNYFKKGQGPGEMQAIGDYFFSEKTLIVHDRRLQKVLRFDFNGEFIREFRIYDLPIFTQLHLFFNDGYYFFGNRIPSTDGKATVIDVPHELIFAVEGGQEIKKLITLPVESFVISSEGGGADTSIAELMTIPFREKYLVLSHTQDYLIKIFNVQSQEIIRSFRRKYDRVKVPEGRQIGGRIGMGGKMYSAPRKYLNDISKLLEFKNNLWIMTSSSDKDKGILIDVYNFEGQYIDKFYLKFHEAIDPISLGSRPMTISGDNLYMLVKNEDETYSIKKFLIEDKNATRAF